MTNLLYKKSIFTKSILLMTCGLSLIAVPASAESSDCPLHKRLAAQQAQQAPVSQAAAITVIPQQVIPQQQVIAPAPITVASSAPVSSSPVSSSIVQQVETPRRAESPVIVKEAQNNYGSGSPETNVKLAPHAEFTTILRKYVSAPDRQGLTHFNYGGLKANSADKAALGRYINKLEGINPDQLATNDAIAYYANLYNAVTVQVVTDNYPLKSIRKLGPFNSGPWKKDLFTINGAPSNLNAVEHDILRKKFPSPYVHYMVNCASVGCPNLLQSAWEANSLDRVKVQAARDYINSPRGVQITPKGLKLSSIFKWFKEDFGGSEQNILRHIREHANPELAAAIDSGAGIDGYDYDWSVND